MAYKAPPGENNCSYIVPSEQERIGSKFCQNLVFDCIMLYI